MRKLLVVLVVLFAAVPLGLVPAPASAEPLPEAHRKVCIQIAREKHALPAALPEGTNNDVEFHPATATEAGYLTYWQPERAILAFQAAPYHTDAVGEGEAGWPQPGSRFQYWMHVRHGVDHQPLGTCNEADNWRYHSHVWCTRGTSQIGELTPCNYDMFNARFYAKPCTAAGSCGSAIIGERDFERDDDTDHHFYGTWHLMTLHPTSVLSGTSWIQFRFRVPNHLTHVYVHCSKWVGVFNHGDQASTGCTADLLPV
jgi:hypothetical protein